MGTPPAPPLDTWLGGSAPAAFRGIGRFADGWLGSFLTPDEARHGREQIDIEAAGVHREIEPDHFGISLGVAEGGLDDDLAAAVRARRPDLDPADLVAGSWADLHRQLDGYLAAGLNKFVITPTGGQGIDDFVDRFAAELLPRQN